MPAAFLNTFESDFKNMMRCHAAHRPEALRRIPLDPGIQRCYFFIREPRIGFGKGNQYAILVPYRKRIIGIQVRPAAMATLGVDQYAIYRQGVCFPFPPVATPAATAVGAGLPFKHHPFAMEFTRLPAEHLHLSPAVKG